jgi:hypothetical protein
MVGRVQHECPSLRQHYLRQLAWGILWEFSYGGAKIHDNTLTDNGLSGPANPFDNLQLLVSCSDGTVGGIEIYQNTIDGAAHPLGLLNLDGHPSRTRNVFVHSNVMTLRASAARVGAFAADGLTELFGAAANNRFDYNTYRVPDRNDPYWTWDSKFSRGNSGGLWARCQRDEGADRLNASPEKCACCMTWCMPQISPAAMKNLSATKRRLSPLANTCRKNMRTRIGARILAS